MLRTNTTIQTPSEEEESAQLAEQRKNSIENEILVLSKNKKDIENSINELHVIIDNNKQLVFESKGELITIKKQIVAFENERSQVSISIEELLEKQKEENNTFNFLVNKNVQYKESIENEKTELLKKLNFEKSEIESVIKVLTDGKEQLLSSIKDLIGDKEYLLKTEKQKLLIIEGLESSIDQLSSDKKLIEDTIITLKKNILDISSDISTAKLEIESLSNIKSDLCKEIDDLKIKIEIKKEEYLSLEKKAFVIVTKENILNQREAFIRSQYERAGIKWED